MVAFQISNTVAARIQLKWSLSKRNKEDSRQSVKRRENLALTTEIVAVQVPCDGLHICIFLHFVPYWYPSEFELKFIWKIL